ncbi:MAG: desulfoferrodoxin family protein [Allisonella histaminiformans]|uniref:desulfoferrodoxin family protein n=1 Tax=Allisonella histaminiformans TaxID=209880 RepID=UPI000D794D96|nr:desulfoferrodoxin family protein [Allisonella histaminiformans]MDY3956891.1 desulfoferrodoxin family protein [Allisonella histaminiformans]PWL46174.1 MAG: desulfoferrodoxin Dfx [Veillonellaceae bacterium]
MEFYRSNKNDRISVFVSTLGRPAGEGADEVLTANTVDAAREKHVPLVERSGNDVVVTVGEVIHPMTEAHYIMWIALETNEGFHVKNLAPGEVPTAIFALTAGEEPVAAYEYCNLHGLWKKEI